MSGEQQPGDARDESRQQFIVAARRCFMRDGISKTNMADVAAEAGLSRPYLYKLFSNRSELLEAALLDRGREFNETLVRRSAKLAEQDDVEGALISQLMYAVSLGRSDPEFVALANKLPRERVNHLFTAADSPLQDFTRATFAPLFARAREGGVLRDDVTEEAMIEWLQGVLLMLAGRDDLDENAERALMRDFVLRGILVS